MPYQEEEQAGQRWRRSRQAVALAMEGRWREAVSANQSLIENFPSDATAYNRLGRAYMELGEYSQAEEAYRRAMEHDPYNVIAKKNLERLSHLGGAAVSSQGDSDKVEPQQFVEETGKAGLVKLYHLASPEIVAKMGAGDKGYLKIDGSSLIVENAQGEYLGQVEPGHEQRLIKLMGGGNKYSAAIVSSMEGIVNVIVREVSQDPSQAGRPSFPAKEFKSPRPYVTDKVKREIEEYEEGKEELGYTIVGGGELGLSPEDAAKLDTEDHNEDNEEE